MKQAKCRNCSGDKFIILVEETPNDDNLIITNSCNECDEGGVLYSLAKSLPTLLMSNLNLVDYKGRENIVREYFIIEEEGTVKVGSLSAHGDEDTWLVGGNILNDFLIEDYLEKYDNKRVKVKVEITIEEIA